MILQEPEDIKLAMLTPLQVLHANHVATNHLHAMPCCSSPSCLTFSNLVIHADAIWQNGISLPSCH